MTVFGHAHPFFILRNMNLRMFLYIILAGQTSASYEEIIDEMISDAWYMVAEYHLNLGPRDNLEFAVNRLVEISGFKASE